MILLLPLLLSCAPKAPTVQTGPPVSPAPAPQAPPPLPQDRAELLYFVMVDRFANGDPGNDQASPGPAPDRTDPQAWHGGDLKGVRLHLDHLSRMGVTRLWLSPVFATRTEPIGEWGAFHGYWQWDPMHVEPRFGAPIDLATLAIEARQAQIGLMLDLVTNHVGYDAPLLTEHPDWFHQQGTITDWTDRDQLENGQVHGLPDLDQDHPEARAWLFGVARGWADALDLSGYRVDAVRHVPNAFLADLGDTVRGDHPDLWWLGEDFTGDPVELAESQRSGHFTHVFDFPLHYAMLDVFCDGAPPARLASVLWQDRLYDRPEGLVTFLDNHDLPRLFSRCDEDPWNAVRALLFMFSTRGVPALQYGTESLLQGEEEPENRGDMVFRTDGLEDVIALFMEHRRGSPAMRGGVQRVLHLDADRMVLARVAGDRAVVVGVNRGDAALPFPLPPPFDAGVPMGLLSLQGDRGIHSVTAAGGMDPDTVGGYAPHGEPGPQVPPHSVRVWRLQGDFSAFSATGPEQTVVLRFEGVPAAAGDRVVFTGAGPELGNWDPAGGVALQPDADGWTGQLVLPAGAVIEGKPVVLRADGSQAWPDGDNKALLVEEGAPPVAWSW